MTTTSDFTARESAIIEALTERFPDQAIDARIVDVHKLEGGEQATLRFTLDDTVSSDLSRERIASRGEEVESLASEVAGELENPGEPIGP